MSKPIQTRILHFLIAFDQFVFSIISLGGSYPDETISAACYRLEKDGRKAGKIFRPLVDFLFLPIEKDHCYQSYLAELNNSQLPKDYS